MKASMEYRGSSLSRKVASGNWIIGVLSECIWRVHTYYSLCRYPVDDYALTAFAELGFPVGEVNGAEENEGFWERTTAATENGRRAGTYKSFVEPILKSADIDVLPFAVASKVLVENGNAVGVRVERFGHTLDFFSRKEVVLSAGAIGSPQILMLSGIGPKDELQKHGIDILKELPAVGRNLQDHPIVGAQFHVPSGEEQLSLSPFDTFNPANYLDYYLHGAGPLSYNLLGVNGVWHSKLVTKSDRPGT